MAQRAAQPKCERERCNHSKSFHDNGNGVCFAMGCACDRWWTFRDKLMSMSNGDLRDFAREHEVSYRGNSKSQMVDSICAGIQKKEAMSA